MGGKGWVRVTPETEPVSVQTRSRSDKNTAVLGSKEPRQVPVFLYGLHRHTPPLPAESGENKGSLLPQLRFSNHSGAGIWAAGLATLVAMSVIAAFPNRLFGGSHCAFSRKQPVEQAIPTEPIKKRQCLAQCGQLKQLNSTLKIK